MKYLILMIIIIGLILVSCSPQLPVGKECSADSDCVPAECCHAKTAVSKEKAPNCAGMFCTMDCQPKTLDCGQGEVKCLEGRCEAVLNEANLDDEVIMVE
jgi:hypothetical protein